MTVSREDARSALHEVETAERHSNRLFGYGLASPYLLLWGAMWIVAGLVGALSPANAGIGWGAVDGVGFLGTAWLIVRHARRCGERGERVRLLRCVATFAVLAAFIGLTLTMFAPTAGGEVTVFITLVVAAGYTTLGCWAGLRYAVVGLALGGLAVGVFFLAPDYVLLAVPVAGGAALILGGLWLRRA